MRIDPSDFKHLSTHPAGTSPAPSTSFVDTLKDAMRATNEQAQESNNVAVELAEGRCANIHEAMVTMQKADISVRLLVSMTNKLVDGYKQLLQLR